jgi:UDP-2,3-diacylglucosamine hydrolase
MKAVFISDAHLKYAGDERYGRLIRFLNDLQCGKARSLVHDRELGRDAAPIDDLYILGDFFDFWFCRPQNIHPEFQEVIRKLVELQAGGVGIHLCEGNHDFFMKEYFQDVLGMDVFEERATIEMDQVRTFIAHGDTLDNTNIFYLMLRKILRSQAFYHLHHLVPSSVLWAIAGISSATSKTITVENGDALVEKMFFCATEKLFQDHDTVILGHCHKPVLRYFDVANKKKTFITLGDWIVQYSFLYYENRKFFMSYDRPL